MLIFSRFRVDLVDLGGGGRGGWERGALNAWMWKSVD